MSDFSVRALIGVTDRISRPLDQMNRRIKSTLAPLERLRKTRMNLSRSLGIDRVSRSFGVLRGKVSGLLGPLTALGAGLSVAGLVSFTQRYSEAGDQVAKTARLIGLSVEAFQELRFAAERSGVPVATFEQSMKAFTKRLGEARQGTGALVTFMDKLDPSIKKNVLAADSTEEAFRRLTFVISEMSSEEDRAALASAAFSRAGLEMVNLMSGGVAEVDALRQKIRDLGGVMSGEATTDAEIYRDTVTNFQTALGGLTNMLGQRLLPVLSPFLERLTESMAALNGNRDATVALDSAMARLADLLAGVSLAGIIDGVTAFATAISDAVNFVGGWENALIGVVVVMNGPLILALTSVAGMIAKIGVLLLANPIGIWAAAIAAAAFVVYDNWGNIGAFFEKKLDRVHGAFDRGLIPGLEKTIQEFNPTRLFMDAIDGLAAYLFGVDLSGEMSAMMASINGVLAGFANDALAAGVMIVRKIVEGVQSAIQTAVGEFTKMGEEMMDGLIGGLEAKLEDVRQTIVGIGQDVGGWFADQLGIRSPSRVFMGYGENVSKGLALGIRRSMPGVAGAVAALGAVTMDSPGGSQGPVTSPLQAGARAGDASGQAIVEVVVRAEPGTEVRRTEARSTGAVRANVGRVDNDLTGPT